VKVQEVGVEACERAAGEMREACLRMGFTTGFNGAHFGGGLSMVEIMAALYVGVMSVDPEQPAWEQRDRFILSKGHGAMAYYAALQQTGFVTEDELMTFKSNDTFLYGHPSMNLERGIEFSSGSLGLGLALGVGTAMGVRRRGNFASRVYVLMGDGECNEGSVWESALCGAHFGLDNLVAIIDKNGLQYDGDTTSILNMESMAAKWESFGWKAITVDGHDVSQLLDAFAAPSTKPKAIIANTVKGKGVSFMEHNASWHHNRLSQSQLDAALAEQGRSA
jgi:transketolase